MPDYIPDASQVNAPPEWSAVEGNFRNAFPALDMEEVQKMYERARNTRIATERHRNWEPPLVHDVMQAIPFASAVRNWRIEFQHGRASQRIAAGRPEEGDYDAVAQYERVHQLEGNRSGMQEAGAFGRNITSMAGEAAIGGHILRGAAAGEGLLARVPGVSTGLRAVGIGAEVATPGPYGGLGGGLVRGGQFAGKTAAETFMMPGMWLEPWARNNIEQGRDPLDIKGLPAAFTVGMMQVALLGSIGRQVNNRFPGPGFGSALARMGAAGPIGVLESSLVDVFAGASGLKTGYGTIGELAEGNTDKAWSHAVHTALSFAAFAGIHEVGNRQRSEPRRILTEFAQEASRLRRSGVASERAASTMQETLAEKIKEYGPAEPEQLAAQGRDAGYEAMPQERVAEPIRPREDATQLPPFMRQQPQGEIAPQPRVDTPMSPEQAAQALAVEQARIDAEGRNARPGTTQPETPEVRVEPTTQPEAAPVAPQEPAAPAPTEAAPDAGKGQSETILERMRAKKVDASVKAGLVEAGVRPEVVLEKPEVKDPEANELGSLRYRYENMQDISVEEWSRHGVNEQQRKVMEALRDPRTLTLEQIGQNLSIFRRPVTRARVEQIEKAAREKIGMIDSVTQGLRKLTKEENAALGNRKEIRGKDQFSWDMPRSHNEILSEKMFEEISAAQKEGKPVESLWLKWAEKLETEAAAEFKAMGQGDVAFSVGPQLLSPLVKFVAAKLIRGGYTFAQFAEGAVGRFGDEIKPHLQEIWAQAEAMVKVKPPQEKRIDPTSVKNEITDAERENRGYWPARMVDPVGHTFPEIREEVMREVARGPEVQDGLIASLKESPRTVSDKESAMLLQRHVELANKIEATRQAIDESRQAGNLPETTVREAEMKALEARHEELLDVVRSVGTESGRALNARKMMMKEDYTLANLVYKARKAKGSDLTVEERSEITKLQKRIVELQKKIEAKDDKPTEDTITEEVMKKPRETTRDPRALRDVDVTDVHAVSRLAQRIAKDLVASGMKDREAVIDGVHEQLLKVIPEITRRETMDAISGYGIYTPLSKDEVSVTLRDLKGQMQQLGKLEDMQAGNAPLKTGGERRTPSDTERRLIQEVEAAKKKGGFNVTDPEKQLKSSLDAVKTRLRHQIDDLQFSIDNKTQLARSKGGELKYDADATKLVEQRDALKKQYEDIFGEKIMSWEQRVALAEKSLEKSIVELERQIETGEVAAKRKGLLRTENLDLLRGMRDILLNERQLMRDVNNPKKTVEEREEQRYRTWLVSQTAKLQQRITDGDFSTKPRKERVLDAEDKKLRFQYDEARGEFRHQLEKFRYANRTAMEKAMDWAQEGSGFITSLKLGVDFPALFRQGMWVASTAVTSPARIPLLAKSLRDGFHALASKENAHASNLELQERENYKDGTYAKMKLALTSEEGGLDAREENFRSNLIGKVPVYAGLSRAQHAFTNKLRANYADYLLATLTPEGRGDVETLRQIGNLVNVSTGRGNFGQYEGAVKFLSLGLLSPRYLASRIQLATLQPLRHKGSAEGRAVVAGEYVRAMLGAAAIITMGKIAFSDDESDRAKTFFDPRSSDFLRAKAGNTRLDALGGVQQPLVALTRVIMQESTSNTGVVRPLHDVPFGQDDAADSMANFLRGRLGVIPGAMLDERTGRDLGGNRVTRTGAALGTITPLTAQDVYQAFRDVGVPRATAASIWAMFGGGLSVQDRR